MLDRYDQRPRAALVGEADAHLRCVLGQYDHDIGQRGDRCLLEQALLEAPVGVGLDAWHAPADYARDVHLWRRDIKPMLLAGTHLTEEFGAVSGAVDAAAKRFLDLGPGQQPSRACFQEALAGDALAPELRASLAWVCKEKLEPKLLDKGGGTAGWLGDETTAEELRAVLDPPDLASLQPPLTH